MFISDLKLARQSVATHVHRDGPLTSQCLSSKQNTLMIIYDQWEQSMCFLLFFWLAFCWYTMERPFRQTRCKYLLGWHILWNFKRTLFHERFYLVRSTFTLYPDWRITVCLYDFNLTEYTYTLFPWQVSLIIESSSVIWL